MTDQPQNKYESRTRFPARKLRSMLRARVNKIAKYRHPELLPDFLAREYEKLCKEADEIINELKNRGLEV